MKSFVVARALAALVAIPLVAAGQQPPSGEKQSEDGKKPATGPAKKIEQITVTASPLGKGESELAQPASVLDADELRRKRAASIGDTLAGETGVQSSAFGPAAGRPVIRGLDGARVRVLENGIGTLDASSVSPDHMVTTESLHADQIEILRGPASLLYGSGAIGGIVNVVSNLIPRRPAEGLSGDVEARGATANRERTLGANLNGGAGEFAWHLDGSKRKSENYRIPRGARDGVNAAREEPIDGDRLPDTFLDAKSAGLGGSWVGSGGYLGAGTEYLENTYGLPNGEGSKIHLEQKRYEISGETNPLKSPITKLKVRVGTTDYQHEEIESSGSVATTFKNRATEGRLEAAHAAVAGLTGTVGVQVQDQDLSALGEEALFPRTRSRSQGFFAVEQLEAGAWTFDAGLRVERNTRRLKLDEETAERFPGAVDRSFNLATGAAGVVWRFAPGYNASVNLTQAQRAPATEELYSRGLHGATATYEVGDPNLRKEVSRNIDLLVRKTQGDVRWKVNVYANRIRDYIYTASVDEDGDGNPDRVDDEGAADPSGVLAQRYSQGDARFRGVEAEWSWRPGDRSRGVRVFGDLVRAKLANGDNLPRISPARLGVQVDGRAGPWGASLTALRAFAQRNTAPLETATGGYTRVDAEVSWQWASERGTNLTVFLQGTNLTDATIRVHTSYLKDLAPLMGRSFVLGLRGEF